MNGVLGHFYALSRLNWAGDNLGQCLLIFPKLYLKNHTLTTIVHNTVLTRNTFVHKKTIFMFCNYDNYYVHLYLYDCVQSQTGHAWDQDQRKSRIA